MNKARAAVVGVAVSALVLGGSVVAANAGSGGGNTANRPAPVQTIYPHLATPRAFAAINADGTFARGRSVSSVFKLGTGVYDIRFVGSINRCGWTGTTGFPGFSGSLPNDSGISVTGRAGTLNGVFVQTSVGPDSVDLPFTVVVVCS